MEETAVPLLDMEEGLKKDADGTYRKEIVDQFAAFSSQIKRTMDSGLPPDEFQKWEQLRNGVDAASNVVEKVWGGMHGS